MEEVPRCTSLAPLASPRFVLSLVGGGNRRAFRLPAAGGDHFHYMVEPLPDQIRCRIPSTPKLLQYKKILRGINFVKITKNIFQPPPPQETKNTTHGSYKKKSVAATNSRENYKKTYKEKPGGELICKHFGANGSTLNFGVLLNLSQPHFFSLQGIESRR